MASQRVKVNRMAAIFPLNNDRQQTEGFVAK